ncbi:hypothetical protein [Kineococcus rubinsiae]|uniref:hypothetical protein n=1 Tax=Kineococcus rubinsiae TaxID=2609562 RepID=UPI001431B537|nr:hypothetical protein [Kineococcus rubinsiae]NIZ90077.1 hypothetical protein [Kineococcus rubinsiae]
MHRRTAAAALAGLLLLTAACGDGGAGDAAAACSTAPVPAEDPGADDAAGVSTERRDAYAQAAELAASAAEEDARWRDLAGGYATLSDTAAQVVATGSGESALSDEQLTGLVTQVVAASAAVRRLCAVAEVS